MDKWLNRSFSFYKYKSNAVKKILEIKRGWKVKERMISLAITEI